LVYILFCEVYGEGDFDLPHKEIFSLSALTQKLSKGLLKDKQKLKHKKVLYLFENHQLQHNHLLVLGANKP
jgi:hypothetical protein